MVELFGISLDLVDEGGTGEEKYRTPKVETFLIRTRHYPGTEK